MKHPRYYPLSKDPIMKTLISVHELSDSTADPDLYIALIESIISQQLSVKASDTIFKRFLGVFGDKNPVPGQILPIPDEALRAVGISYAKIKYIKGIDEAVSKKTIDLNALHTMNDEDVIAELTKLKGIGRWTAEMLLIFSLKRDDIFSLGDLGLRNAVAKLYNVDRDDLKTIEKISMTWSPYRSYASRLLWKSLDNTPK
jgi:DNA-3-methyladenine glycosylase II